MALTKVSRGLLSTSIVDNGNATAITIDSSENVLVGTTDDVVWDNSANSSADNGHNLRTDGRSGFSSYQATAGSNATINVNRTGSDGDLIRAFKSGNLVGSIGTIAGYMTAGTSDTGVLFHSGEDSVQPWNVSTNAGRDNAINLGASNARFKDLHLSGHANFSTAYAATGIYLGAYASPNLLDDYEEGTWTPTIAGATTAGVFTYSVRSATYTKIGNRVSVICAIYVTSTTTSATGDLAIEGLPFPVFSAAFQSFSIGWSQNITFADQLVAYAGSSASKIALRNMVSGGSGNNLNGSALGNSFYIFVSGVYQAA